MKNVQLAKKYYNVDMYNGMFSEYIVKENSPKYDLIFLSHVLEHIVNPKHFIEECKSICNKYIFIEVPSMDYKFVEEPMGMFCEEHVNYFTLESLTNLMISAGFALVDVNYIFGLHEYLPAGWPAVSTIWEITEKSRLPQRIPVLDSELIIKTYIEKNMVALEKLKKKTLSKKNIVKVYDSDVRKHVYTFNDVNISYFDENNIYDKKIECILVATYTAQKAISRILEKYKDLCTIFYLYDL